MSDEWSYTFSFGDRSDTHERYNLHCDGCWSKPYACGEPDCYGLVHTAFGDEDIDCNYWMYYYCDVCGEQGGS